MSTVYLIYISNERGRLLPFAFYALVSNISCFVLITLLNVDAEVYETNLNIDLLNIRLAGKLLVWDIKLLFMLPLQISFGFASSYIPFYLFGTVIKSSIYIGSTNVIGMFARI